jgi:hypothetical protein
MTSLFGNRESKLTFKKTVGTALNECRGATTLGTTTLCIMTLSCQSIVTLSRTYFKVFCYLISFNKFEQCNSTL